MAKFPTRKHLAKAEKEQRFRLALISSTVVLGVLVVGLVGYGLWRTRLIEPTQPVAIVNDREITTLDFRAKVRFSQLNLLSQIQSIQQILQFLDEGDALVASYEQQLENATAQLNNPFALGSLAINQMIEEALIEEEANRRGIYVSEQDIDQKVAQAFGYFPQGTPTPRPSPTPATAMVDVTPAQTLETTATALPSPTPYTEQAFRANLQRYLDSLESFEIDEAALRNQAEAQLYQELLQQEFEETVPRFQEQVWARHILVDTEEQAIEILSQLEQGEQWESLAAEFSTDLSNKDEGGNLGWFPRGVMVEAIEEAAFAGEQGAVTGPIETVFGWHLIEVLGHADRELETPIFLQTVFDEFQKWLQARREESEIVLPDYWVDRIPDLPGA